MADDGKEPKDDLADDDDDDDEEAPAGARDGRRARRWSDVTLQDGALRRGCGRLGSGPRGGGRLNTAARGQTAAAPSQMPSGEWHGYFFNPGDEGDEVQGEGVKLKSTVIGARRRREPVW